MITLGVGTSREAPLRVRELDPADHPRWDAFVDACPDGTFFHRAGWQYVLRRGLGHDAPYLLAERNGAIEGVLPLGHVRSALFGNALVSTPFCPCGGALATTEAARAALEARALELARVLRVDHLELRHRSPRHPDWPAKRERYVTFRRELDPDPEVNLQRIPRKQRAVIRKGIASGLEAHVATDTDRFYAILAESMRNLGTPVFPRRYFRELKAVFGRACEVLYISPPGAAPVAAVMSFYFRDEVLPYHGGGKACAREWKANDFMYWELMRRSALAGLRVFDYGRSKVGSGSEAFKRHWGFHPQPLHYEYTLVRGKGVPDVSPMNPKYRFLIASWRRLPLRVSCLLGPMLARNLG